MRQVGYCLAFDDGKGCRFFRGYDGFVIVGSEDVAKGYSMGVVGMCAGEKRKIITPPDLAYGSKGLWPIVPPNTPLEWHTQLLRILESDEDF